MEKLDKVIAGLECCGNDDSCLSCPYKDVSEPTDLDCIKALSGDALDLLKGLSADNQRLREMWADATKKLSVVCAERDFAVNLAQAYGEFVEATLEKEAKDGND